MVLFHTIALLVLSLVAATDAQLAADTSAWCSTEQQLAMGAAIHDYKIEPFNITVNGTLETKYRRTLSLTFDDGPGPAFTASCVNDLGRNDNQTCTITGGQPPPRAVLSFFANPDIGDKQLMRINFQWFCVDPTYP